MRRLASDSALTRGSKGPAASNGASSSDPPSSSRMRRPLSLRARASALPTMPAPTMIRSACIFAAPRALLQGG
ncbi:hypothetical protein D3C80_625250 [compost metagenome]